MTTEEMEARITTFSEYAISSAVNDIETIESQTLTASRVIKIYFQPGRERRAALAQVTARVADDPAAHAAGHRTRRSSCASTPPACRSSR